MIRRGYYSDGRPASEIPYHEGQIHGIRKAWYYNGQPMYKIYYLYGDEVTQKEYRRHELIEKLSGL